MQKSSKVMVTLTAGSREGDQPSDRVRSAPSSSRPRFLALFLSFLGIGIPQAFGDGLHVVLSSSDETEGHTAQQNRMDVGPTHEDAERIVRAAYERLAQLVGKSEKEIEFILSDFETIRRSQFDEFHYADIVTFPSGWVIDVTPSRREERETLSTGETRRRTTVEYLAEWSHQEVDWDLKTEGRRMLSLKLDEVLDQVGRHDEEAAATVSMTRYKVRVMLEGRSRTYRAAFFWMHSGDDSDWRARPLDLVTQGLAEAAVEPEVSGEWKETAPPTSVHRSDGGVASLGAASTLCIPNEDVEPESKMSTLGTNDHILGNHHSEATFEITCTCQSSCNSTCSARVADTFCEDIENSLMGFCHQFGQAQEASSDSQGDGHMNAPSCAAGYGCVQKTCELCFCGVSVSVGISGTTVDFSESGEPDWTGNLKKSKTCALCTAREEEMPDEPPGSEPEPIPCDCCEIEICTPIVLDLAGNGFQFTNLEGGVQFDLGADGAPEQVAWTQPGGDDAFLALDRNGNDRIDDGAELFGAATDQPESETRNGYKALKIFDATGRGGDEDGFITQTDAIFQDLILWRDSNQDGISQAEEMTTLEQVGVEAISLDWIESRRRDRHGNLLRWTSKVQLAGVERLGSVDVIFLTDDAVE